MQTKNTIEIMWSLSIQPKIRTERFNSILKMKVRDSLSPFFFQPNVLRGCCIHYWFVLFIIQGMIYFCAAGLGSTGWLILIEIVILFLLGGVVVAIQGRVVNLRSVLTYDQVSERLGLWTKDWGVNLLFCSVL